MTARQVFEAMLVELNNTNAPSLLLDDYNYFINKAIDLYINKRYLVYDTTQQTTDDLRVLKATAILPVDSKPDETEEDLLPSANSELNALLSKDVSTGATAQITLPSDYLHMLNCVCVYQVNKQSGCYNAGDVAKYAAKRLTADAYSVIMNDYYNRPTPKNPYFYINNLNTSVTLPTNPINQDSTNQTLGTGNDPYFTQTTTTDGKVNTSEINLMDKIKVSGVKDVNLREKEAGVRYGNATSVRLEVRYGQKDVFVLKGVMIDYLKAPQHIRLTKNQMDLTEDTSQILEFPDYVCQEIIRELVTLVMQNNADPRIQTFIPVNQSIVDPARQQATTEQQAQ